MDDMLPNLGSDIRSQLVSEMRHKEAQASCKTVFVLALLDSLAAAGHRTLVFSQSIVMLDILQVRGALTGTTAVCSCEHVSVNINATMDRLSMQMFLHSMIRVYSPRVAVSLTLLPVSRCLTCNAGV